MRFTSQSHAFGSVAVRCFLVALTALLPPIAARAEQTPEETAASAALADLASTDASVRSRAAARIVELGSYGGVEIARRGADLDDRAWKLCADGFAREGHSWLAPTLVAAMRDAPAAHARRLRDLAHALDPVAGVDRSPEEIAAEVRRLLGPAGRISCFSSRGARISLLGHGAVAFLLEEIRNGDPKHVGDACDAVKFLAEKEDLPAIRELLLLGRTRLAPVLDRMQRNGIAEATDALLDAIAAGRIDSAVTLATQGCPDKARVLQVLNGWVASQCAVDDSARAALAVLFKHLDARDTVPVLESWLATSKESSAFVAIAEALVHFRNSKGVEVLVRIASERRRQTCPCVPPTAHELAVASAPGRLCPDGFSTDGRSRAAQELTAIAGKEVFDVPEDWSRRLANGDPLRESDDDFLDRAAAAFGAWWDASKHHLRYDATTGKWLVDR
jgi:hypothetical protein